MQHNEFARKLFADISIGYDQWAEVFSLFQYSSWHASLIASLNPRPSERVLDLCTGTGAVALALAAQDCVVVGLDLSHEMLREALLRRTVCHIDGRLSENNVEFVEGRAEDLPFASETFDAVAFSFLLRYVADPGQPMKEIARVLRDGGRVAMLEFAVPTSPITRFLWRFYAQATLPLMTRPVSPGWANVGAFLGKSIADFYERYPLSNLVFDWKRAGFVNVYCQPLSLGGAIIVRGEKV